MAGKFRKPHAPKWHQIPHIAPGVMYDPAEGAPAHHSYMGPLARVDEVKYCPAQFYLPEYGMNQEFAATAVVLDMNDSLFRARDIYRLYLLSAIVKVRRVDDISEVAAEIEATFDMRNGTISFVQTEGQEKYVVVSASFQMESQSKPLLFSNGGSATVSVREEQYHA